MTGWTDPAIARLRELHDLALSNSDIAIKLNAEFGTAFTRNAVIGKRARLGLAITPEARSAVAKANGLKASAKEAGRLGGLARAKRAALRVMASAVVAAPVVTRPEPVTISARMLGILDLEHGQCRFVCNDPRAEGGAIFCAADVVPDSSWCPVHRAMCVEGRVPRPWVPTIVQPERTAA